ncbi:MAG: YigZ family protein [Bacteroidia bacterium]|nr:YigZ family protein [Bacteroidia bacterium]
MQADDTYLTISGTSEGLYKEKASKFMAFAFPVSSETEIKKIQLGLRKKYYDANHHCFAWRLGADKKHHRANDDGEPGNSAGMPILGQIQSKGLTNILIVVIRYFGGTKLGVSGLMNAYRTAAANALASAVIIEKTVCRIFEISFGYAAMNEVMSVVKDEKAGILNQEFDLQCKMKVSIRKSLSSEFIERFRFIEAKVQEIGEEKNIETV